MFVFPYLRNYVSLHRVQSFYTVNLKGRISHLFQPFGAKSNGARRKVCNLTLARDMILFMAVDYVIKLLSA